MFRSSTLRLAAVYTAAFAVSVLVLGAVTMLTTRATLRQQFDVRIQTESLALAQEFRTEGLTGVAQAVSERDRTPGAMDYGLEAPGGGAISGRLAPAHAPLGWSTLRLRQADGEIERIRVLTTALPQGYRLTVGDDDERSEGLQHTVLINFGWAFAGVVVLGVLGGYGLSRGVHRRLARMTSAAEDIIHGDFSRRIPVSDAKDDIDRLAVTFNRTLDRVAALVESLRQVSNDIAHDLRTPLTRLRQRLEAARATGRAKDRGEAIAGALQDVDAILETFAGLLRIAQIESGARRAAFREVNLAEIARSVVDDFAPSAEDAGQQLTLEGDLQVTIEGDRELLTQMLVNLVDNALRHAGPNARVIVRTSRLPTEALLIVTDNGPGIPPEDRPRVFDRFYRLEHSRSTPGSGLGLALVAAIARLHGAMIELVDAGPGLEVRIAFPASLTHETLGNPNLSDRLL